MKKKIKRKKFETGNGRKLLFINFDVRIEEKMEIFQHFQIKTIQNNDNSIIESERFPIF